MHGLLQLALLILNSPQFLDSPVGKEAVQLMSDLHGPLLFVLCYVLELALP